MARRLSWLGIAQAQAEEYVIAPSVIAGDVTYSIRLQGLEVSYKSIDPQLETDDSSSVEAIIANQIAQGITNALIVLIRVNTLLNEISVKPTLHESKPAVKITGPADGRPIELLAESTSVSIVKIKEGTSPSDFFNPKNWLPSYTPEIGDLLTFETSDNACIAKRAIPCPSEIVIRRGFRNAVELSVEPSEAVDCVSLTIGSGELGDAPKNIAIDFGEQKFHAEVICSGKALKPTITLTGNHALNVVEISNAQVQIGDTEKPTHIYGLKIETTEPKPKGLHLVIHDSAKVDLLDAHRAIVESFSVPGGLIASESTITVEGQGNCNRIDISNGSIVTWKAGGNLGLGGSIKQIESRINGDVVATSINHGLQDGDRVYLQDIDPNWDRRAFTIWKEGFDAFGLVGIPLQCGRIEAAGTWGLSGAVKIGSRSELKICGRLRNKCFAPIELVNESSKLTDQDALIEGLIVAFPKSMGLGEGQEFHRVSSKKS